VLEALEKNLGPDDKHSRQLLKKAGEGINP